LFITGMSRPRAPPFSMQGTDASRGISPEPLSPLARTAYELVRIGTVI